MNKTKQYKIRATDRERFSHLRNDFAGLRNDPAHETILEHDVFKASVESINHNNETFFKIIQAEPAPDVYPFDGIVFENMIEESTKKLRAMIDNLTGFTPGNAEKMFASKYIRLNLLMISELLIARSKDLDKNTTVFEQITAILPEARSFFRVSDATTPNRELVRRAAGKKNIKDFLSLVERI